jgi:hypothetical protein
MGAAPDPLLVMPDIRQEAERLTAAAIASGLPIRLMGGVAIWLLSPTVRTGPFARDYADMDYAAASKAGRTVVGDFFTKQGYIPEKLFNALHGAQRLNFAAPDGRWTIDVVFDELNMSHRVDLRGRLNGSAPTIDPADLLLTKLQVWEINPKDFGDLICLLADVPLSGAGAAVAAGANGAGPTIDIGRIQSLTRSDWGLCHTVERNLRLTAKFAREHALPGAVHDPAAQAEALLAAIEAAPKSLTWRTRARVGERVRWYETPEEVRH